ncbi:fungal-specific transcription factor domain-containing protein [Apiosordaria backusii]|uniref:Fungal-specific transcription factor domain-containing protein n=1 Tax=Apiosordaria backusii TaxID=314023 RepID=A0AA40EFE7_9PEZI|nr:fungal-specific transcription factor domain-containing protein [Apiosordaria backusii]
MPESKKTTTSTAGAQQKACHNCRRRRLRCDKSVPSCHKCSLNGEECLGYGTLFRWANAPAVRGRLALPKQKREPLKTRPNSTSPVASSSISTRSPSESPSVSPSLSPLVSPLVSPASPVSSICEPAYQSKTLSRAELIAINREVQQMEPEGDGAVTYTLVHPSLLDPFHNSLDRKSKHYIHHFSNAVCRDLVSIDQQSRNPFRATIPLAGQFDCLQSIIVATGAMHLATLQNYHNRRPGGPELVDALVAKGKAVSALKRAVAGASDGVTPTSQAMILAAIVFFVNLDLIDNGKGSWQAHIEAASTLITSIQKQIASGGEEKAVRIDDSLMRLVDAIAADCLTYRIFGTTISGVDTSWADSMEESDLFSVLRRAEAHSYHCCPPVMLEAILATSRLFHDHLSAPEDKVKRALELLSRAKKFDVVDWVYAIQGLSLEQDDLSVRVSLARAHRAAACLYILLCVPDALEPLGLISLEPLVMELRGYIAEVPLDHVLLKGLVWPVFMAGAQTNEASQRVWYAERLESVWAKNPWICPWGYIRTAIEMMKEIWEARDAMEMAGLEDLGGWNWLAAMKSRREQCLIV